MPEYPITLSQTDATGLALSTATRADEAEGFPLTLSEAATSDGGGVG